MYCKLKVDKIISATEKRPERTVCVACGFVLLASSGASEVVEDVSHAEVAMSYEMGVKEIQTLQIAERS